jgi:hypothetical protein
MKHWEYFLEGGRNMDLRNRWKTGIRVIFCLIFISSLMLFHIPHSLATIITYDYTGVSSDGTSSVAGSFGYDTDAEDQWPADNNHGRYLTGFINATVTGGIYDGSVFNYTESGTDAGDLFIDAFYSDGDKSFFDMREWIVYDSEFWTRLILMDQTAPFARTDDLLPPDLILADYDYGRLYVGPVTDFACYLITSITKRSEPVPEPSTFLLLGFGLAVIGLLRRRYKN